MALYVEIYFNIIMRLREGKEICIFCVALSLPVLQFHRGVASLDGLSIMEPPLVIEYI